jgi:phosphate transport system substrate-binding protein
VFSMCQQRPYLGWNEGDKNHLVSQGSRLHTHVVCWRLMGGSHHDRPVYTTQRPVALLSSNRADIKACRISGRSVYVHWPSGQSDMGIVRKKGNGQRSITTSCKPVRRKMIRRNKRNLPVIYLGFLLVLHVALVGCRPETGSAQGEGSQSAIQNKGSDTLVNLALAWAEAYRDVDPSTLIAVTGGGSGTGIAALINGTVDIANASRPMKEEEIASALANGIEPVEIPVATDALGIIVHLDNPVSQLTLDQLADMFTGRVTNWNEVGGNDAPIVLLSRESNSGTHVYFLEEVVRKGESDNEDIFAPQTLLMPSSVGITSEIRRNPNAIGYDGLGYITEHEKVIAIAKDSDSPYVLPSADTAADGSYPLSRYLYMYIAGEPTSAIRTYLDWILGPEGQAIVKELGFVPLETN